MPRGSEGHDPELGHLAVVTVGERHRLQIPAGVLAVTPWWSEPGAPVECLALTGLGSSLVLVPELPEHYQAAIARLREEGGEIGRLATAESSLARYFATSWRAKLTADGRVTMPEEARKLGLAPRRGQVAVVFALGMRLEVWTREHWLEQIDRAVVGLDDLVESVLGET